MASADTRRRLARAATCGALLSLAATALALAFPTPTVLEVSMSLGQATGILVLSLYLLALALDEEGSAPIFGSVAAPSREGSARRESGSRRGEDGTVGDRAGYSRVVPSPGDANLDPPGSR